MPYVDEDGYDADHYKTLLNADSDDNDADMTNLKANWLAQKLKWKVMKMGGRLEFRLVWAETKPEDNCCIAIWNYTLRDKFDDALTYIERSMKMFNKAIKLPSDVVLMDGDNVFVDIPVPEDPYQEVQMLYVVGYYYRFHGEEAWSELQDMTHFQRIWMRADYSKMSYVEDDDLVWNYVFEDVKRPATTLSWALGKEIYQHWGNEEGISDTVAWRFRTDEEVPRTLLGSDEYWLTHGYPEGRKYLFYNDGIKKDSLILLVGGLLFILLKKTKVGLKTIVQVGKILKLFGDNDDPDITSLERLDLTADEGGFGAFVEVLRKLGQGRYW